MKGLKELCEWDALYKLVQHEPHDDEHLTNNLNSLQPVGGIQLNCANQQINQRTSELLIQLASKRNIYQEIDKLTSGAIINTTENKAAIHTALRDSYANNRVNVGHNIADNIDEALIKMQFYSDKIRQKQWCGSDNRPIKNVVNIGIGGSDLGPRMSVMALKQFSNSDISCQFISDADPVSFHDVTSNLERKETLFIIASKSFTTFETMLNFERAVKWIGPCKNWQQHFIAITANPNLASERGIENILPIWDWVGGRYSLCSAINFILMISIGHKHFQELLNGSNEMDLHFKSADLYSNIPVQLAMNGIWNINFRNIDTHAVLTYNAHLELLVPYLQQLEMESNGKSTDTLGRKIDYLTCPIIWGGHGNRAQHSYYQHFAQGTKQSSIDFIFDETLSGQMVYELGKVSQSTLTWGHHVKNLSYIAGGVPSSEINMTALTPRTLGALVAMYEHKVFTQSVIWGINPFDQFGVDSVKQQFLNTKDRLVC